MVRAREGAGLRRCMIRRAAILGLLLGLGSPLASAAPLSPPPAVVPAPGVRPHSVRVGSILDLTGPLAAEGIAIRDGLTLAFDEVNAKGGVGGRKLKLAARNSAYDPDQARAVARDLLKQGVFAVIGANGTPPVTATATMIVNAGVLQLFPFVPAHAAYSAMRRLEFAMDLPIAAQIQLGVKALLDQRGTLRVGILYRADRYGRAALRGAARELARRSLNLTAAARYAPGTGDLFKQLRSLRDAGVELVVLGAVPQESFRALAEAHRLHWYPIFLCPSACYVPEAATLGGRSVEGLYSVTTTPIPYPTTRNPMLSAWIARYEHRFGAVASMQALRAYLDGKLFAEALARCGPHPTPLRFARVLEAMPAWSDPKLGGVPVDYTANDHLGLHAGYLAEIVKGRWHIVSQPIRVPAR
jgi:ABC-type branched-subunit amino acid transport system substrate-binding protein